MQTSNELDKIAPALVKAQAELKHAIKDAENPAFKRGAKAMKYADLGAVWDAAKPVLTTNKLCALQDVVSNENGMGVRTRLLHESGQWIEFDPPMIPLAKKDAHGAGSVLTYGRRYSLSAALGVVADEDDDGNAAVQSPAARVADAQPAKSDKSPPGITAVKTEVRQRVRDINGCADADSLLALINQDDFKAFAFKVCRFFPSEWIGPEDNSGLSGSLANRGDELKCDKDVDNWIHRMERARDEQNKTQAAAE